jgi:uncharacterized Zn finger protein
MVNTKCPKCGVDDKSRVRTGMLVTSEVCYVPFYDNQGKKHFHDDNYSYWMMRCMSCGKSWREPYDLRGCWCGWQGGGKGGGYDGPKMFA